jgi:hypothetical protein
MGDEDDGTIFLLSAQQSVVRTVMLEDLEIWHSGSLTVFVLDRSAASLAQRSSASLWISVFVTLD